MKKRSSRSPTDNRMLRPKLPKNVGNEDDDDADSTFSVNSVANPRYSHMSRSDMALLLEKKERRQQSTHNELQWWQKGEQWWQKGENVKSILVVVILTFVLVHMHGIADRGTVKNQSSLLTSNLRASKPATASSEDNQQQIQQQQPMQQQLPPGVYAIGNGQVAQAHQMLQQQQPQIIMQQPPGPPQVHIIHTPPIVHQQPMYPPQQPQAQFQAQIPQVVATNTDDPNVAAVAPMVAVAAPLEDSAVPIISEDPTPPVDAEVIALPLEVVPISKEFFPTLKQGETNEQIPLETLNHFKDTSDPWDKSDTAVFWHIPKAGGSTIKDTIGGCHRKIWASEFGVTDGHDQDTEIAIVYPAGGEAGLDRSPFVNVDTTTVLGIARAKQMGFADAGLADAVVSPFIYEANELFTDTAKGRLFTVFRHPIDRAVSMFYYLQVATWEPTYKPELKEWTIEQYAKSDIVENNWMTRQLANALSGDLNNHHLEIAMEVIRRKFLVGLMTSMEKTMTRCEQIFQWTYHVNPANQESCRTNLLSGGSNSNAKNKKEKPKPGDISYEALSWQNNYDLQLYAYIEQLFVEQENLVTGVPENFREIDGTCCKCDPATFPPEGFTCPVAVVND